MSDALSEMIAIFDVPLLTVGPLCAVAVRAEPPAF
jgi:hypothetical protein